MKMIIIPSINAKDSVDVSENVVVNKCLFTLVYYTREKLEFYIILDLPMPCLYKHISHIHILSNTVEEGGSLRERPGD